MCTEESADTIVVCDVAIQDVRDALVDLPGISFVHLEGEGTRVINTVPAYTDSFRENLKTAINRDR